MDPGKKWTSGNSPSYWAEWEGSQLRDREFLTLKAVQAVREFGCEVVFVLALVDRLRGARALFQSNGITDYRTVFTIRDFGIHVPDGS